MLMTLRYGCSVRPLARLRRLHPALADRLRHVERAVEDDVGDGVEGARREALGRRDEVAGGVVDQAGEAAAVLPQRLDHRLDGGGIADVDAEGVDAALGELRAPGVGGRVADRLRRPQMATSAPRRRNCSAIAWPRPVPPPVTRMRWPVIRCGSNMVVLLAGLRGRVGSEDRTSPARVRGRPRSASPGDAALDRVGEGAVGDAPVGIGREARLHAILQQAKVVRAPSSRSAAPAAARSWRCARSVSKSAKVRCTVITRVAHDRPGRRRPRACAARPCATRRSSAARAAAMPSFAISACSAAYGKPPPSMSHAVGRDAAARPHHARHLGARSSPGRARRRSPAP